MNHLLIYLAVLLFLFHIQPVSAAPKNGKVTEKKTTITAAKTSTKINFSTDKQRISYAFGVVQGRRLLQSLAGFSAEVKSFQQAMADLQAGAKLRIEEKEHDQVVSRFQELMLKKQEDPKNEIPAKEISDVSYVIGYSIAKNISAEMGSEIDLDFIAKGYSDVLEANIFSMSEEDLQKYLEMFHKRYEAPRKTEEVSNYNKGLKFLADNKKNAGVKVTPSGLQYKILVKGTGASPGLNDTVKVHYKGSLVDGEEFDSSYKRNEPAEFKLTAVIPGWTEILQMMPKGSKWQVIIPSELGYGRRDAGPIKAFSTLVFEIELLDILPATYEENADDEHSNHDGHDH